MLLDLQHLFTSPIVIALGVVLVSLGIMPFFQKRFDPKGKVRDTAHST